MAIYHLHAQTGSRKNGQSAAAKSDYIQRQGKYSRGQAEVLASGTGHMPAWAADPRAYWAAADAHERANGRLYKEVEFSLPVELSLEQQQALVEEFAEHVTGVESLPFSYAIHAGRGTNPHCHLMVSERVNDGHDRTPDLWFKRAATGKNRSPEDGGARKSASLKPRQWLEKTREAWADHANRALDRAGISARVDHRSYAAQGIDRLPQIHLGTMAAQMVREGRPERSDRASINLEILASNTEIEALREQLAVERQERIEQHIAGRHQLQIRAELRALERAQGRIDERHEAEELAEWEAWTDQPGVCSATGRIVDEVWMAHKLEQSYRESQRLQRLEAAEHAAAEPEPPARQQPQERPQRSVLTQMQAQARQQPLERPQTEPQATPALTTRERALADARALFSVPNQRERMGIIRDAVTSLDDAYADAFEDALVELKIGHFGELPPDRSAQLGVEPPAPSDPEPSPASGYRRDSGPGFSH